MSNTAVRSAFASRRLFVAVPEEAVPAGKCYSIWTVSAEYQLCAFLPLTYRPVNFVRRRSGVQAKPLHATSELGSCRDVLLLLSLRDGDRKAWMMGADRSARSGHLMSLVQRRKYSSLHCFVVQYCWAPMNVGDVKGVEVLIISFPI
jgi:hypothetical protein